MPILNGTKVKYAQLAELAKAEGFVIRYNNEYKEYQVRLNEWDWKHAGVYFTSDLQDAFDTGKAMVTPRDLKVWTLANPTNKFADVNSIAYDTFNTVYCEALVSTPANSPERHWIVDNAAAFERAFFAGYNVALAKHKA